MSLSWMMVATVRGTGACVCCFMLTIVLIDVMSCAVIYVGIVISGSHITFVQIDDRNALWLKAAFDWHTRKSLIGAISIPNNR